MGKTILLVVLMLGAVAGCCAALPAIKCSKGDTPAACFVNPCQKPACTPKKTWECVPNYCNKKTTYLGQVLPPGPCTAVWINKATKKTVRCPKPEFCIELYKPVCGTDGKTYSNDCYAAREGVGIRYSGPCAFPDKCKKVYKPVCDKATDTTYANACTAGMNGVTRFSSGACRGRICAKCVRSRSCATIDNPCKGKKGYTCSFLYCQSKVILDDGSSYTTKICNVLYTDTATGFPAAACITK